MCVALSKIDGESRGDWPRKYPAARSEVRASSDEHFGEARVDGRKQRAHSYEDHNAIHGSIMHQQLELLLGLEESCNPVVGQV